MNIDQIDHRTIVRLMYNLLLGREPDPEGFASHVMDLASGAKTPHEVVLNFIRSAEFQNRYAVTEPGGIAPTDFRVYAGYRPEDLAVFAEFAHAAPGPRPGFLTEFLGSRARISSLWDDCRVLDGKVLPLPVPHDYHADAVEWIGTLKAVLAASESFAAMEWGAGHGPWTAVAGIAARLRGIRKLTLCAVEGDPGRFALLRQNIEDNDLANEDVILLQAAVGTADGTARWPKLADPRNVAGARPLRDGSTEDAAYLQGLADEMIDVEVVSATGLLLARPFWDLLHIDVQGTEAELCETTLGTLSERVRYVIVGTHSRKLDGDVMDIFFRGGWRLEHEKPARMMCSTADSPDSLTRLTIGDGTQVWRNPRY